MESSGLPGFDGAMTTSNSTTSVLPVNPQPQAVRRAIERRSVCTLATTSAAGWPHVATVAYGATSTDLWVSTLRNSRKARNLAHDARVAVCIPIRRLPVGPPSSVQFQSTAAVVGLDDPDLRALVEGRALGSVTSHGELELEGGCFLRIALPARLATFGLGLPLRRLIADPLAAGGHVAL